MRHTPLWIVAVIIAFAIIVSFVFSVPHTRDVGEVATQNIATASIPLVTLRDTFKKGLHTITGSITVPDACTTVSAEAITASSTDEGDSIHLMLSISEHTGVCLELPTTMLFHASVRASTGLPIIVTVNGVMASTSPS